MNILEVIIEKNRTELESKKQTKPIDLNGKTADGKLFYDALSRPGLNVIAELKSASPSKGVIRQDFHPAELASELAAAGAAALSVLTEKYFFKGSLKYLRAARSVTQIPILRKDFIFDEYQLYEAVQSGANAILLIASALPQDVFLSLQRTAYDLGLEVLAEAHTLQELEFIVSTGTRIIGLNCRNLKTFKVDLELTLKMLNDIPDDRVKVAESGIRTHRDMLDLQAEGANAFLIGETLMHSPAPGEKLRELLGV
ncbi:indole-3-glycerol phosphate synthase TrpC [Lentisphaerota bacterium ZTH]|nr:indole-3-glycerol phosphate synthase TrpC [Lentisphaerota bacterium]WET05399.1 indole-3-glycerol phosphate synthase TrpC [Lentisphaerota bacterium ZTH]